MFFLYQYAYSLGMGHSTSQFFDEVLGERVGVKKESETEDKKDVILDAIIEDED